MSAAQESSSLPKMSDEALSLAFEWRRFTRIATFIALLTAPAFFLALNGAGISPLLAALVTVLAVVAFRGTVDVVVHRFIPRPSLFGASGELRAEDAVARRRRWSWQFTWRLAIRLAVLALVALAIFNLFLRFFFGINVGLFDTLNAGQSLFAQGGIQLFILAFSFPLFMIVNILILLGPMLISGVSQMKSYEPGDASWGVRLSDVRGQVEPKQEVQRIISLWQSSDDFKKAGGKPERGLLFLGAPGTGKTMLSKAIATSFNCPFVAMPGSGFAGMFIGVDVIIVSILFWRARRLSRKWGGQCIVFIDEIDAVGRRRQALSEGGASAGSEEIHRTRDAFHHGQWGALTASEDVVIESRAWRDYLFTQRAEPPRQILPPAIEGLQQKLQNFVFPGAMGGGMGSMALNQLLVKMDGMDDPPLGRRVLTKRVNTLLDMSYLVPPRIGSVSLRLPPPRPRNEQVYFIGATNVPIGALDPALIRPGRMGRHIWFRTPTKDDRSDIFDLYLGKVSHVADLDRSERRDEMARMTGGYSPAMIEQACSMALTIAHTEGRQEFTRQDLVEAMTTVETGTAQGIEYVAEETRATAIHEAGHAATSYLFEENIEATRLTIRKRGNTLGHFRGMEIEERFSSFRHEEMADLIMVLGAMAAEVVFYGENSRGVAGDIQTATALAAMMVGLAAMAPIRIDLDGRYETEEDEEEARAKLMAKFERIGNQLIRLGGTGFMTDSPVSGVLNDKFKRPLAAQILGQAFVTAYQTCAQNRASYEYIAEQLIDRRELHGDEVVELLRRARLRRPDIDLFQRATWPKL